MLGMWGLAAVLLLMLDMVPSVELLGVGIATVVTLPYLLNKKVLVGAKNQLCNMAQGGQRSGSGSGNHNHPSDPSGGSSQPQYAAGL